MFYIRPNEVTGNDGDKRLRDISQRLGSGEPIEPITVRELLGWFGAQRRGYTIVARIAESLQREKLKTKPDFEATYIDSSITFFQDSNDQQHDNRPVDFAVGDDTAGMRSTSTPSLPELHSVIRLIE